MAAGGELVIGCLAHAVTFPLRAQLVNLNSGACFESLFMAAKVNTADKVVAKLP